MLALFKLQLRTHYKNPSWIMGYITSALFLSIFGGIAPDNFTSSVASVISITLITQGLMTFGFSLLELRKSVIFKRIGSTSITKPQAMLALFSFSAFETVLIIIYTFGIVGLMDLSGYATFNWGVVNWGSIIYAIAVGISLSLALAFMFVAFSKNIEQFNMYAMLYFFFATFLAGLFFPGSNIQWMQYIGYAVPHTYISSFMTDAFLGAPVFSLGGYEAQLIDNMPTNVLLFDVTGINPSNLQVLAQELTAVKLKMGSVEITNATFSIQDLSLLPGFTAETLVIQPSTGENFFINGFNETPSWKACMQIMYPLAIFGLSFYGGWRLFKWDAH